MARGIILNVIAQVVGTDSIFATQSIVPVITSLQCVYREKSLFEDKILIDDGRFVVFVSKDPESKVLPLREWMGRWVDGKGHGKALLDAADAVGNLLHNFVVDISHGGGGQMDGSDTVRGKRKTSKAKVFTSLSLEDLQTSQMPGNIDLGKLGLIILEDLNHSRDVPFQDEAL